MYYQAVCIYVYIKENLSDIGLQVIIVHILLFENVRLNEMLFSHSCFWNEGRTM